MKTDIELSEIITNIYNSDTLVDVSIILKKANLNRKELIRVNEIKNWQISKKLRKKDLIIKTIKNIIYGEN
jgi:oxalate decarboxylase/phosphoglucose isomerase-like protein (cupin superfamily)